MRILPRGTLNSARFDVLFSQGCEERLLSGDQKEKGLSNSSQADTLAEHPKGFDKMGN